MLAHLSQAREAKKPRIKPRATAPLLLNPLAAGLLGRLSLLGPLIARVAATQATRLLLRALTTRAAALRLASRAARAATAPLTTCGWGGLSHLLHLVVVSLVFARSLVLTGRTELLIKRLVCVSVQGRAHPATLWDAQVLADGGETLLEGGGS